MGSGAFNAYAKSRNLGLSGRALEAEAFLQAARALEASAAGSAIKGLRFTHSLWTLLQAELLDPTNRLPEKLKSDLLNLSAFVDEEVTRALTDPTPARLKALSKINKNLAAGLLAVN